MEKISWEAPEYIHTEKTSDWYWIVGIITLTIAIIAIILNNLIFGILIIVSSITLSLYATRRPEVIDITIERHGVHTGKIFYPYSELDSYWVETREIHHKIILKSKKKLMLFIVILIVDENPEYIEEYLSDYLPKIEHREPLFEKLLFYFGF